MFVSTYLLQRLLLVAIIVSLASGFSFPINVNGEFVGSVEVNDGSDLLTAANTFCSQLQLKMGKQCDDKMIEALNDYSSICWQSEQILKELDLVDVCRGVAAPSDAAILKMIASDVSRAAESSPHVRPTKYVEIGSHRGCSTFVVANLTSYSGGSSILYSHDLWPDQLHQLADITTPPPLEEGKEWTFLEFYRGVYSRQLQRRVIPIRGPSNDTLEIHDNGSVSVALVDGDHSYEGCIWDLRKLWPKMQPSSPVYIHDSDIPDVKRCITEFIAEQAIEKYDMNLRLTTYVRLYTPAF